jgi:hypothetical protein|tara:strand:+ start:209 stop:328 length:120 start_codon:yes stop_codon:yes gene_type:complete
MNALKKYWPWLLLLVGLFLIWETNPVEKPTSWSQHLEAR